MDLGRRPAGFFDDVDLAYVVAQLEDAMEAPVDLGVSRRRSSGLLLPGAAAPPSGADEGRRAEQLAAELAALEPRLRVALSDGVDELPTLTIDGPAGGGVRFVGVPRANLFRAMLEAIRRASNGDHGLDADRAGTLRRLPEPVHARVFATPT